MNGKPWPAERYADSIRPSVRPALAFTALPGASGADDSNGVEIAENDCRALAEFRGLIRQFRATSEEIARAHGPIDAGARLLKELSAIHRAELRVLEPHLVRALSSVMNQKETSGE